MDGFAPYQAVPHPPQEFFATKSSIVDSGDVADLWARLREEKAATGTLCRYWDSVGVRFRRRIGGLTIVTFGSTTPNLIDVTRRQDVGTLTSTSLIEWYMHDENNA
eukprot:m.1641062 g.1641062  ORF g.1641062 m.1641062 type:complete len:106 (+) comp45228_c0_seq1:215-532(+)